MVRPWGDRRKWNGEWNPHSPLQFPHQHLPHQLPECILLPPGFSKLLNPSPRYWCKFVKTLSKRKNGEKSLLFSSIPPLAECILPEFYYHWAFFVTVDLKSEICWVGKLVKSLKPIFCILKCCPLNPNPLFWALVRNENDFFKFKSQTQERKDNLKVKSPLLTFYTLHFTRFSQGSSAHVLWYVQTTFALWLAFWVFNVIFLAYMPIVLFMLVPGFVFWFAQCVIKDVFCFASEGFPFLFVHLAKL